LIYNINPVAKPRMTQSDRWNKRRCVTKYWDFKDKCTALKMKIPTSDAKICFWIQMPKSWSKKKKSFYVGQAHLQKPDLSNLLKAVEDACYVNDSIIWHYAELKKRWAYKGAIEITVCDLHSDCQKVNDKKP